MSRFDLPDGEIGGQISIDDYYADLPGRLFAVSKVFTRAKNEMSLAEQKVFVCALSELRFTEEAQSNIVTLDKKMVAAAIGINEDTRHMSAEVRGKVKDIWKHSGIHFANEDADMYEDGALITGIRICRGKINVIFNERYMSLFTGLSSHYITMWSRDIFRMTSKRSIDFYEYLREATTNPSGTSSVLIGVQGFKKMFDIPKEGEGSYMREKDGFDRAQFERRVVDPLCDDLKDCEMINLLIQPDGKYYVKEKQNGRVRGYRFFWTFSKRPGIATAKKTQEIREAIDKDPQVLKVARDIVEGKKNPKKKKTTFTDFEQRSYDYDELEAQLLRIT